MPSMPCEIDTEALRVALFMTEPARTRIAKQYELDPQLRSGELECALWRTIGQAEESPEIVEHDSREVFRAAVRAIGSGARTWASFKRAEPDIRTILGDFEPMIATSFDEHESDQLRKMLRGLTARRDTRAVLAWAARLVAEPDYHAHLRHLRCAVAKRIGDAGAAGSEQEVTACAAVVIGAALPTFGEPATLKAFGMGPILASEFLRNLGWSGFKPDRHVQRLLRKWFDPDPLIRGRARELAEVLGAKGSANEDFLYFSCLGADRCPAEEPVNKVDHLVWLFGSVVAPGKSAIPDMTRLRPTPGGES